MTCLNSVVRDDPEQVICLDTVALDRLQQLTCFGTLSAAILSTELSSVERQAGVSDDVHAGDAVQI